MPVVSAVCVPHPPIILPEVGRGEERKIQKTIDAYGEAMRFVAGVKPQAVVVISPHADLYADWFLLAPGQGGRWDFARFGAPGVRVAARYDEDLAAAIAAEAEKAGLPAGPLPERGAAQDHGSAIPLCFLAQALEGIPVVRIGLSGLPAAQHYRLGQCIAGAAGAKRVAVIASGDLSHRLREDGPYGFVPEGPVLDAEITGALAAGDFGRLLAIDPALADRGAECGLRAFVMLAGALDGQGVEARLLSYEGTFGVGYAVATFLPTGPAPGRNFLMQAGQKEREDMAGYKTQEDAHVRLARRALESWLVEGKRAALPGGLPAELTGRRAGAFVSLHKQGELRGCIGTIGPTTGSVAEEILQNAVSAACEDPRFAPVEAGELDALEIKVDVLGEPEDIDGPGALDVKRYGVIVSSGGRRGLLLPDLEGVDTVDEQVSIAMRKAGIPPGAPVKLQRFEVVRHT